MFIWLVWRQLQGPHAAAVCRRPRWLHGDASLHRVLITLVKPAYFAEFETGNHLTRCDRSRSRAIAGLTDGVTSNGSTSSPALLVWNPIFKETEWQLFYCHSCYISVTL